MSIKPKETNETDTPADASISVCQVRKIVPGNPTPDTVIRWMTTGFPAANGERIKLKYIKFGSRRFTSRQWIDEFREALQNADTRPSIAKPKSQTVRRQSSRQRQRQIADAKRELARA